MIKKNTKMIFKGENGTSKELVGGIPLSKGEILTFQRSLKEKDKFKVIDKIVEIKNKGEDQIANITYKLKKIK